MTPAPVTPAVAHAARKLAELGYPVFPCGPDKAPKISGGFKAASSDPEQVEAWERAGLWDNDAMIGMAVPEGMVILDIDPRNGGTDTLGVLDHAGFSLSHHPTRHVQTRSGGDHWYYTVPEGVTLRATLGPGVDVKRAGKGYVIVPPSAGYVYITGGDPAPLPKWLIEELQVEEREGVSCEASDAKYMPFEQGTAYGLAALHATLGRLVLAEQGERNDALNKAAFGLGQLAAGGELESDHAAEALYECAQRIGLNPGEAKATILSGWSAGEQEPRQAPERQGTLMREVPLTGFPEDEGRTKWVPVEKDTPEGHSEGSVAAIPDEQAPFKWVTWDIDEPEPPFYAHPILPKNAYLVVYGATEAAKSMAWLGILAEGSHLGLRSSLYSLENPPATDRDRLRRWAPDPACLRLTNEPLNMFDRTTVEALIEREKEWKTDVIMIDTYSHAFNSHSDDGNAKAVAFARVVRYVMAEVGCSVIVIDHTGFVGDEIRDASAKRQQVDVAIYMEKNGEWAHGAPARFTMTNRKAARFGNPFYLGGSIDDGPKRKLELRWASQRPEWRL